MGHPEGDRDVKRNALLISWLLGIVVPASDLRAEELGRLFFDAKQRTTLDEKRKMEKVKGSTAQLVTRKPELDEVLSNTEVQSVRLPEPRITGRVTRSSGNNTVWINHYPQYKKSVE